MGVRRVVTGHDQNGKAVVSSDGLLEPITVSIAPGAEFYSLWGSDTAHTYPGSGNNPSAISWFPPVGGFRFGFFTIPPGETAELPDDMEAAVTEVEAKLPGLLATVELDEPGMHTSDTTDFDVVVSGEVILELDDGLEIPLRAGDTVVQNGTRHRWRNGGSEVAVLAFALVGAHRS